MARAYVVTAASALAAPKTIGAVMGTAATRAELYDILMSVSTPSDTSLEWIVQRVTSVASGTNNTAVVPVALDPGNPAAVAVGVENFTIEPTKTSATEFIDMELNQRASFRWVAAPGRNIIAPATAQAGIGVICATTGTGTARATIMFEE